MGCCASSVEPPRIKPTGQCLPLNCDFQHLPEPGNDVPLPHYNSFADYLDGFGASMPALPDLASVPKPHPMNELRIYFLSSTPGTAGAPSCAHTLYLSVTQPLPGHGTFVDAHPEPYEAIDANHIENVEVGKLKGAITRPHALEPAVNLVSFQIKIKSRAAGPLVLWVLESDVHVKLQEFNDKLEALLAIGPIIDSERNPIKHSHEKVRARQLMHEYANGTAEERAKNPRLVNCNVCAGQGRFGSRNQHQCIPCNGTGFRLA